MAEMLLSLAVTVMSVLRGEFHFMWQGKCSFAPPSIRCSHWAEEQFDRVAATALPKSGGRMPNPSELIDDLIARTPDWRGEALAKLRRIIQAADPQVTEEWKWISAHRPGTPVWEHNGIVCHINILKDKVKLTLYEGASLTDPQRLFNASLEGNKTRAIDIHEGDKLNEGALRALIRSGVERNLAKAKPARKKK